MPIIIMIIIAIEVTIIIFLLGYNVHTNRNLEQAKKSKKSFSRILALRDIMNISASSKSSKEKMEELNKVLIEKMDIDYSTIVYYNGLEYITKVTNISDIEIPNMENDILYIQNLNIFKEAIDKREFKYITVDKQEEELPYLENRKNIIKSVIFYPMTSKGKYIGYWLIESKKVKAFENVDIQILENLKQAIRNTIEVLSYEEAIETMVRDDKFSELKTMEYLQTEGKMLLEQYNKPQIVMFRIDNLEEVNEEFSRNAGNVLITEVTKKIHSITRGDNIFVRYMGPKFIIILDDKKDVEENIKENNTDGIIQKNDYMEVLKNIKENVENIKLVQTDTGVFKKEYLEMLKKAEDEEDDDLDIFDEIDNKKDKEDLEDNLDTIESVEDTKEDKVEEEKPKKKKKMKIKEKEEVEPTYIIPRLNIVVKEYDKGNLEYICRKLENYLEDELNRGKSEIKIL
jgi:GGDEF domain